MKSALLLLAAALAGSTFAATTQPSPQQSQGGQPAQASQGGQASQPAQSPQGGATQPSIDVPSAIQAINQARDPSAAIEAYARARGGAVNPNDAALQQAYVHHMVDLGAPELADAQAQDLVRRHAADAETMGVAAYMDAQRGQIPPAITNLKSAIALEPDNPFLLRTAAQVVVWYDTAPDRSMLSKDDVAGIEALRAAGNNKTEFSDAYRMAFDARQRARQQQQQESASTQPSTTPYIAEQPYISSAPTTYYYSGAPYAGGGYYPYYYPYYGYGDGYGWWGGWGGSILILNDGDFHHHHHHFHDGFHSGFHDGFARDGNGVIVGTGGRNGFVSGDGVIVGHDATFPHAHRSGGTVIMGPQLLDHVDGVSSSGSNGSSSTGRRGVMGPMPPTASSSAHSGSASILRAGPSPAAPSAPARAAAPVPSHGGGNSSSGGGGHR